MNRTRCYEACQQILRRVGSAAHTGTYEAMRGSLPMGVFEVQGPEIPVLASAPDEVNWIIVTTDRVVASVDGSLVDLELSALAGVQALALEGGSESRSDEGSVLVVQTLDGARHELRVEPGLALGAI